MKSQFLSKFCLTFLLILSLNGSISSAYGSWLDNANIMFGFCSTFTSCCCTLEKNWKKLNKSLLRGLSKTCKITAKPRNTLILWSQLSLNKSNLSLISNLRSVSASRFFHQIIIGSPLASFLSGGFTTLAVINPPERKLAKRTSVQCTAAQKEIFQITTCLIRGS